MFSFFKKKPVAPAPAEPAAAPGVASPAAGVEGVTQEPAKSAMASLWEVLNKPITLPFGAPPAPDVKAPSPVEVAVNAPVVSPTRAPDADAEILSRRQEASPVPRADRSPGKGLGSAPAPAPAPASPPAPTQPQTPTPTPTPVPASSFSPGETASQRKSHGLPGIPPVPPPSPPLPRPFVEAAAQAVTTELIRPPELEPRSDWFGRLRQGLRRTGSGITQVFTGTRIDDALYEELESALLLADAGVPATEYLLADLKRRVKAARATEPAAVKMLLADALTELLAPLEKTLTLGETSPTVIMVAGVNGAGKTTSIGKLTKHLAEAECKVLLAAADTFRAAAREQLAVWADRNRVEIVSQEGGDPSAVTFDAVTAGRARGCDVVIADTAGRLPTQVHLMDELRKIQRTIAKAQPGAPHEVLLVVDGNTGQNALSQVKSFDAALGLTGLIVTKLDGTAKGGVLAAIARWGVHQREGEGGRKGPVPVYFVGIGEKLEDLQTFNAREFAQALVG